MFYCTSLYPSYLWFVHTTIQLKLRCNRSIVLWLVSFFLLCFSVNCYNGVRFLVTIQHVCVIINVCNDFCINSCFNGLNSLYGACFTCASTLILRMKLVVYSNKITCISSWSSKYIWTTSVFTLTPELVMWTAKSTTAHVISEQPKHKEREKKKKGKTLNEQIQQLYHKSNKKNGEFKSREINKRKWVPLNVFYNVRCYRDSVEAAHLLTNR